MFEWDFLGVYDRWRKDVGIRKNGEPLPEQWETRSAMAEGIAIGMFFMSDAISRYGKKPAAE